MACSTCDGYELVPGADGMLERCADCAPHIVVCPLHQQKVMTDPDGRIVGKCWGCVNESANARQWLRENPLPLPLERLLAPRLRLVT